MSVHDQSNANHGCEDPIGTRDNAGQPAERRATACMLSADVLSTSAGACHLRGFCVLPTAIIAQLNDIFTRSDPWRNDLQRMSASCTALLRALGHLAVTKRDVRSGRLQNYVTLFLGAKTETVVFTVSDSKCQSTCD
jgi:hypothetical protein